MINSLFSWQEEPQGAVGTSSLNFASDAGGAVLNILMKWSDLAVAIPYIVGYGIAVPGNNNAVPLSRMLPAVHPQFNGLRATRILSITGEGPSNKVNANVGGTPFRTYGVYQLAKVSIQFEALQYPTLTDLQMTGLPEYMRFVLKNFDTDVETLARRGEVYQYIRSEAVAATKGVPGDLLLRQPKGLLRWKWFDVPEDWILYGRLVPTNFQSGVSTVNLNPFPLYGYKANGNVVYTPSVNSGDTVNFPPGTLLLLPVKTTPRIMNNPGILNNNSLIGFFPRTYDVEFNWIYFNPWTFDQTNVLVTVSHNPPSTPQKVLIRGHNLTPLPYAVQNSANLTQFSRWFAMATKNYMGTFTPSGNTALSAVLSDSQLLYRYTNHENLFLQAKPFVPF